MSDLPVYSAADVAAQQTIDLPAFGNDDAVDLGLIAVETIRARDANLAVRIELDGDVVFQAKVKSTGPGNDPWLAGKAAAVHAYGKPSLQIRREHEEAGSPFEERTDVDHEHVKAHGGSIPIRVAGSVVGTITMSGEPDVVDHDVAAASVAEYLRRRETSA